MAKFGDNPRDLPFGQLVARREITLDGRPGTYIVVEIGTPQCYEDEPSAWFCPYRIAGERVIQRATVGIDAVQALQLTMKIIGTELMVLNRDLGGRLRFLGEPDLGFPTA